MTPTPRNKFQTFAASIGIPWPLRWPLSVWESLLLLPTLFMEIAFEVKADNFGKQGIPISLPAGFGGITNFQPQLFPMEIFLLWVGAITLLRFRQWPLRKFLKPLPLFTVALMVLGILRALPDIHSNPLLVVRNSAFVWYLALPVMIALYPLPSFRWETFFRLLYFVTFIYFAYKLAYPVFLGDTYPIFWSIDLGLLFGFAYGLCAPGKLGPRVSLVSIGFILGLSYFSGIHRTTFVGLVLTNLMLFASSLFFSERFPVPRWRRMVWVVLGIALGVFSVTALVAYQKGTTSLVAAGTEALSNAHPQRNSENNSQGLEKFRYYLWSDAWKEFKDHPFVGIGMLEPVVHRVYLWSGEFMENTGSFEQISRFNNEKKSPPIAGPHNSYLNALSRLGILGLGFFLLHIFCGWYFLTRCYFACFFVLLWQMLYAFFNVSLEGPIRSFPILILVGAAMKLAIETTGMDDGVLPNGALPKKKPLPKGRPGQPKKVGLVHVPYRFLGGEEQYVSVLRKTYQEIGLEPISIPAEGQASDLLLSAGRSLTVGNPSEWDALLEKHSIEFLHINNIHAALGPAFLRWVASRGIPAIMTVHNHRFYCTNGLALYGSEVCKACRGSPSFVRPILRNCNASLPKSIYHSAAMTEIRGNDLYQKAVRHFLAPSPYIAREMQTAGFSPSSIRVFPHAVHVENVAEKSPVPPADVAFVGRLSAEKGIMYLLAAAEKLPKVSFAIVGAGPLENEVKAAAARMPHVKYYGRMEQPHALAVLRDARVVCVPSVCHESFSLVAAEALSFGARLVVPDSQSFLHYAEAPFSAVPAVVTNPESLAYSITTALEQPRRSPEETAAIRARFSIEGFRERLKQVVAETLS
ncbi:MAG: glycosyltransferase [Bdellovibrionota bacterium]